MESPYDLSGRQHRVQDVRFVSPGWQSKNQPKYNRKCWFRAICKREVVFRLGFDFLPLEWPVLAVLEGQISYRCGFALGMEAVSSQRSGEIKPRARP